MFALHADRARPAHSAARPACARHCTRRSRSRLAVCQRHQNGGWAAHVRCQADGLRVGGAVCGRCARWRHACLLLYTCGAPPQEPRLSPQVNVCWMASYWTWTRTPTPLLQRCVVDAFACVPVGAACSGGMLGPQACCTWVPCQCRCWFDPARALTQATLSQPMLPTCGALACCCSQLQQSSHPSHPQTAVSATCRSSTAPGCVGGFWRLL